MNGYVKLYEAIGYLLNRWDAMTRFTTDGRYAIDNNGAERSIGPSVIGRKNYEFFGSDRGGEAGCLWYTLIQSARSNHVRVLPYLNDVLRRLPRIVPEYLGVGDAKSPFDSLSLVQLDELSSLPNGAKIDSASLMSRTSAAGNDADYDADYDADCQG